MALETLPVVIVSIFGRGHWLATELMRRGIPTRLLDVSDSMGSWIPEDTEGPFGFFQSERLKESHMERFLQDDAPLSVPHGFTVWLDTGPVEMKGPVASHRLDQLGVSQGVRDYLQGNFEPGRGEALKNQMVQGDFSQNWLAQLAHAVGSRLYVPAPENILWGRPLNLFSNFMIRMVTRQGHGKSLEWCRQNQVQVYEKVRIVDVSFQDRRHLKGLEIKAEKSEKSELLEGGWFVWCLSSEETGMLGAKIQQELFPHGILESDWYWARFRIKFADCNEREQLPLHCLIIEDLGRPWTHENFSILKRTGSPDLFDVWVRLPTVQRFNRDYLHHRAEKITEMLKSRSDLLQPQVTEFPVGYDSNYGQVGPVRLPIYNPRIVQQWERSNLKNVSFDSPEEWTLLGWEGMLDHHQELEQGIWDWWVKLQAKMRKSEELKGAEL